MTLPKMIGDKEYEKTYFIIYYKCHFFMFYFNSVIIYFHCFRK